jgi:hypothetical protein
VEGERRRVDYCVESTEERQKENMEFGATMQPILCINCYMRNLRLAATTDG